MKEKINVKDFIKRAVSGLLAFAMLINIGVLEIFADILPAYEMSYSGGGKGTKDEPYKLKDAADFSALDYNVKNIANYSHGKYFEVVPDTDSSGVKYISMQALEDKLCIGGLGTDSRYWFRGNIDFKNTTIYSDYPIFGTLADGATVSYGAFYITGDGSLGESAAASWGGIASAVQSASANGKVSIHNVEVSLTLEEENASKTALGGIVGVVGAGAVLEMDSVEVSGADDESGANIEANRLFVGGAVGAVLSGASVSISKTTVFGMIVNNSTDKSSSVGGFVGASEKGSKITFNGECSVPSDSLMSGKNKGIFIGSADHALAYTGSSFSLKLDNNDSVTLDENKGADNAVNGAVYGKLGLTDADKLTGSGTSSDPYIIDSVNDLLLLAAAVNTGHSAVLALFGSEATKDSVQSAYYKLTEYINMAENNVDTGFNGIGYYSSADDYEAFSGEFVGAASADYTPTITLEIDVYGDYVGLFGLVHGNGKPVVIKDINIEGALYTAGSVAGAVAAQVGIPDATTNAGAQITGITSNVTVIGHKSGNVYLGGLIGRADFSDVSGNSSLILDNNKFGGSITADGSYVGGLVGALYSQDQGKKDNELTVSVNGYTFSGAIKASSASAAQLGGTFGAIVADGKYTASNNSATKPGSGFGIVYNTTKLTAHNITISGSIDATASGAGGFAAGMAGVDADIENITLSGKFTAGNAFGGIAQTVGGTVDIKDVNVTSDMTLDINGRSVVVYSGLIFGNSLNAWVNLEDLTVDSNSITFKTESKYADLSSYTFYYSNNTYRNGTVLVSGVMNYKTSAGGYTPSKGGDLSRYYYDFTPVAISGSGTKENPFIIDSAAKLQTLSVFNNLPSSLSWTMLEYFPDAVYGESYTDVDKVMYIKLASYSFAENIDLTGITYYPASIIGGDYIGAGEGVTITFAATADSANKTSPTRENHSGLFTTITAYNALDTVEISNLTFTGQIGGTYYPGALASGWYVPNQANIKGHPGVYSGRLDVSNIKFDSLGVVGSYSDSGSALLIGYIRSGVHTFSDIYMTDTLPTVKADALIGLVDGTQTVLQLSRVDFPEITASTKYFNTATFISNFAAGTATYSYNSLTDENIFEYKVDSNILPASQGNQTISINPADASLDIGLGTAESPFMIYSAAQLFALARVIQTNGKATLGEGAGNLTSINLPQSFKEKFEDDERTFDNPNYVNALVEYLASAHYRLMDDIDFCEEKVLNYVGIGSVDIPFKGSFDGRNFKVTLSAGVMQTSSEKDTAKSDFGLFGYISGATIRNLVVTTETTEIEGNKIFITGKATNDNGVVDESYNGMVAAVVLGGDNVLDNITVAGEVIVAFYDKEGKPITTYRAEDKKVYFGGYIGHIEAGTVTLINMPENYCSGLRVWNVNELPSTDSKHFASVCPSVKDGYIFSDGNQHTTVLLPSMGDGIINGKVNESLSYQIGPASGGSGAYTYSLLTAEQGTAENLPYLPSNLGISIDSQGRLVGTPKYAGEFEFSVRVQSTGDDNTAIYDIRTYTLSVVRDEYPELVPNTNVLDPENISYSNENVSLTFTNFPSQGSGKVTSNATLRYECEYGNGVIEISEDGTQIKILSVGQTTLAVIKPQDSAYEECRTEIEIKVVAGTIIFSIEGQTWYYGQSDTFNNKVKINVEGIRGLEKGLTTETEIAQALAALGFGEISATMPKALLEFDPSDPPAAGSYRVTINEVVAADANKFAETLGFYNIEYRHGVINIVKKKIQPKDYTVSLKVGESENYEVQTNKTNRLWYNNDFIIKPVGDYNEIRLVTGDNIDNLNDGWETELEFTEEQADNVIYIQLRKSETTDDGVKVYYVTDTESFRVMIDKAKPAATVTYTPSNASDPSTKNGADYGFADGTDISVYKNEFRVDVSGTDSGGFASGIEKIEYIFLSVEAIKSIETLEQLEDYPALHEMGDAELTAALDALVNAGKAEWKPINNNTGFTVQNAIGVYYVRAVDKVGNTSVPVTFGTNNGYFVVDVVAPTVTITNEADFNGWQTYSGDNYTSIPLNFTVTDELAGVESIKYTIQKDGASLENGSVDVSVSENGTYEADLVDLIGGVDNGIYTVTITATDKLGNEKTTTLEIKKDKTSPTVSVSKLNENGEAVDNWEDKYTQSKTFEFSVGGIDPSGILSAKLYKVESDENGNETLTEVPTSIVDGKYRYTATEEGTYRFVITKNTKNGTEGDAVHLSASADIEVPKIDNTKLELTVKRTYDDGAYTINGDYRWTKNLTFHFAVTNKDALKGTAKLYGTLSDGTHILKEEVNGVSVDGISITAANIAKIATLPISDAVENDYTFWIVTESGVKSEVVTSKARVDNTIPSALISIEPQNEFERYWLAELTGGLFFTELNLDVTVSDAHSGVNKVTLELGTGEGSDFKAIKDEEGKDYAIVCSNSSEQAYSNGAELQWGSAPFRSAERGAVKRRIGSRACFAREQVL